MAPRTRYLGQYFTPAGVARFAWQALRWFAPDLPQPRVIDPACGPGVFLQQALDLGITAPDRLWGCDADAQVEPQWQESGLAGSGAHLRVHDGLLDLPPEIVPASFDVVIGNPPFHGMTLREAPDELLEQIGSRSELWRRGRATGQASLNGAGGLGRAELRALATFPSELIFLERFHELCRLQGWMAVILPEGICANERWRFVREWLLREVTLHAVVGLPRGTFRRAQTTAKTCLLVMEKRPAPSGHEVKLAEVEQLGEPGEDDLARLLKAWQTGEQIGTETPWLPVPDR